MELPVSINQSKFSFLKEMTFSLRALFQESSPEAAETGR
jgi:hypothetical protein